MIENIEDMIKLLERTSRRMDLLNQLLDMISTRTDEMSKELKDDFIRVLVTHAGGTIDDNSDDATLDE
jgi:hypothetical protein